MISSILYGLAYVVDMVLQLALGAIIISIGISWFNADPRNSFVSAIHAITEPMYRPFRKLTRKIPGPFDFAPMAVIMIIVFLQKALPTYLKILSMQFR